MLEDLNSISMDSADFYTFGASLGDFYGQNLAELGIILPPFDSSHITDLGLGLQDLNQNSATDGQVVAWSEASGKWEPAAAGAGDLLANGTIPMTANWPFGDFDLTGAEKIEADTIEATVEITTPLVIGGTGTTSDLSLKTTSGVGATGADMHFLVGNNGATEAMTILNNGRAGIGTTSPDEELQIYGNSVTLKLEDDSGNDGQIRVGNSQLTLEIDPADTIASSDICFKIDGAEVARFHQNTNVSIGTILTPPEKLSVAGNIATGDTTTGDTDVFHYFSIDGSWVTEYLKWDDGASEFQLSDGLNMSAETMTLGTVAGAVDFGEATSLEIPNGADPDVDAVGEISYDTENYLRVYDGSAQRAIPTVRPFSGTIYLPDSVRAYGNPVLVMPIESEAFPYGITLTSLGLKTSATTTDTVTFVELTDPADATHDTLDVVIVSAGREQKETTLTDSVVGSGNIIYVTLSASTGLNWINVFGSYYINVE